LVIIDLRRIEWIVFDGHAASPDSPLPVVEYVSE
jgi:hypothetical protein